MPYFENDAVVFGILCTILAGIIYTSHSENKFFKRFYAVVPSVLLMYFIPSLFNSAGLISGDVSKLYYVASRYLLPACLIFLTLSIDFQAIMKLGSKALIMFFTGTLGIMIGGPMALVLGLWIFPDLAMATGENEIWRGLSTVAGSWIGGGANQAAMYEIFKPAPDLFSAMLSVDIIFGNIWLGFLLYGTGMATRIDNWLGGDTSAIEDLKKRVEDYKAKIMRITTTKDLVLLSGIGFGFTGLAHWMAGGIAPFIAANFPELNKLSLGSEFFWLVVIATTAGVSLSFTKARDLEGAGASKIGSLFIYLLVAAIGMNMNVMAIFEYPSFFVIGFFWITFHALTMIVVAKLIKAPFFFMAVGSQANVGGAASAPIIASAFHPSLASVGVLLAVLGYALGTYGAYVCAIVMQSLS